MKKTAMKKSELRVIKISHDAVMELISETLLSMSREIMCIKEKDSKDVIYTLSIDEETKELTYYAVKWSKKDIPDFKSIEQYISSHVGITTESLFVNSQKAKMYKDIDLHNVY